MTADPQPPAAAMRREAAAGASRRSATTTDAAFVLHSHDWSESSLIVELFTRDGGRIVAAAKGAKRPTSQLRSVLMPFQPISVQFVRQRGDDGGEVRTLRSAEWGGGVWTALRGSAWFAGFYLNELVLRLLARDDPHPHLFDAYTLSLPGLVDGESRGEAALRAFELLLLHETGVLPELSHTTLTQAPLRASGRYALRAEHGLVEASNTEPSLPAEACALLAAAFAAWSANPAADALAALQAACAPQAQALKTLLRAALHYHLGGATLRTRQVMVETQRLLESRSPST